MKDRTLSSSLWTVPYQRNLFFTGRDEILARLHEGLCADNTAVITQPQGIRGLGGIGKTQTALEYACRYRHEYQAVFWVRADSPVVLTSDFVHLAHILDLPEKDEQDQTQVVTAVLRWLRIHTGWLLVLDNVEDLEMIAPFIPLAGRGHVLLTTRAQSLGGIAERVTVEKFSPDMAALFLLRRAEIIDLVGSLDAAFPEQRLQALTIAQAVDGLPLALDQAGAYIKETHCDLSEYLSLYQERATDLLGARGETNSTGADYPDAVATTWSLSFEKVRQTNPVAAELLCLCALLYPDDIPEELFIDGAPDLGPVLQLKAGDLFRLNDAMRELRRFSLLHRESERQMYTIHRLVQAVLKGRMGQETRCQWAERIVRAINRTFPSPTFPEWSQCQRLIIQAQACVALIEEWHLVIPEAALLLHQAGSYLEDRAQYWEAEPLLERAPLLSKQAFGAEHTNTAASLNNLANLCREQGRYEEAESLLQLAISIWIKVSGAEHADLAAGLHGLGSLYAAQGKYDQAEKFYNQALTIWTHTLGKEHPRVARGLNSLAVLYERMGRYNDAETWFLSTLELDEKLLGLVHPDTATDLNNLANLYVTQGRYREAEQLYQQALMRKEQALGTDNPKTANSINNLAALYYTQGDYQRAEPLFQRVLTFRKQTLGENHPETAQSLNNLAALYESQGHYSQAELLYQEALAIWEKVWGTEHPDTVQGMNNLAELYREWGRYEQAEPLYLRALEIREQILGATHPLIAQSMNNLACLYYDQGRYDQAELFYQCALAQREQLFGAMHPLTATSVNNLATLYDSQGRYDLAEPLYRRSLAIREQALGPHHPDRAVSLNNLATLYFMQGMYAEAEPLYLRAFIIWKQTLGTQHPYTMTCLYNLLAVYESQSQYEQANQLYQQEVEVCGLVMSPDDPHISALWQQCRELLDKMRKEQALRVGEEENDKF
jgi:tetratricopeptide (TPR) repeat protein